MDVIQMDVIHMHDKAERGLRTPRNMIMTVGHGPDAAAN
jgi:hypothetical protein